MPILGLLGNHDAESGAYFFGLQHHAGYKAPYQVVRHDEVGGCACECTDGVDRHVAPQLKPNVVLNVVGYKHLEASLF